MSNIIDIPVICSVGLEYGLDKYRNYLPEISDENRDFVKQWNRVLLDQLSKPEYKDNLGIFGRAITKIKSPKVTGFIVDRMTVPTRTYYYAERFLYALQRAQKGISTIDFGSGLSPLLPLQSNYKTNCFVEINPVLVNLYTIISEKLGVPLNNLKQIKGVSEFDVSTDSLVSNGVLSYLSKSDQIYLLEQSNKFKNIFIELPIPNMIDSDKKITSSAGAEYSGERLSFKELEKIGIKKDNLKTVSDLAGGFKGYSKKFKEALQNENVMYYMR